MKIKKFFRKDISKFQLWTARDNFLETKEYKEGFEKIDMGESVIKKNLMSFGDLSELDLNYYPGVSKKLLSLLAKKNKVDFDQIFISNGSLSLIELLMRLFIDPSDEVLATFPTYPLYEYYTLLARGKFVSINRINYQEIDLKKFKQKISNKTKLIFVDNPSNPFGYLTSKKIIVEILDLGFPTIIDEAYIEFSGNSSINLIKKYPNLIILRTFSKAYALAGIRLGYVIASNKVISGLIKIKNPEETNVVSQFIGYQALRNKASFFINKFIDGKNYLIKNLTIPYLKVYPSKGAYIMIKVLPQSPKTVNQIVDFFYKNKILIKKIDFPGLSSFIRLNITPIELSKKIISIFKNIYEI